MSIFTIIEGLVGLKKSKDRVVETNSTTTPLGSGGAFTGTFEKCLGYSMVSVVVRTNVAATDALVVEWSTDGVNVDAVNTFSVPANVGKIFTFGVISKFFRVRYVNGVSAQSYLRLQTILHVLPRKASTHRIADPIAGDDDAELMKSIVTGKDGDTFYNVRVSNDGALMVGGFHDVDGDLEALRVDGDNDLSVVTGRRSAKPVYIVPSTGTRSFWLSPFTGADVPAQITSSTSGPFAVGGQSLTINVNGTGNQIISFATRAATAGTSVSAEAPALTTAGDEKLKVSINGGAVVEIKLGKDLTSPQAIAAAIQTQIRALVPNGTNVTCDYGVTNAFRYTIKSGTTGASSSVVITNSGAGNVADELKLGVANGGVETQGRNANAYSASEVVELLSDVIQGSIPSVDANGRVLVETQTLGSSSTILVTSGGANTALGFPTTTQTGAAGSGATSLAVNASSASPQRFDVTKHPTRIFHVTRVVLQIRGPGAALKRFGSLTELTNGIVIQCRNGDEPIFDFGTFRTNAELIGRAVKGDLIVDAFDNNDELVVVHFDFEPGVRLRPGSLDTFRVMVRDNLSGLVSFTAHARGWLE